MGGDVRAVYDPKKGLDMDNVFSSEAIVQPNDLKEIQGTPTPPLQLGAPLENLQEQWQSFVSKEKHHDLHDSLVEHINKNKTK